MSTRTIREAVAELLIAVAVLFATCGEAAAQDTRTIEENPARSPASPSASDLLWAKKAPYGDGDDFRLPLGDITIAILGDVDFSADSPDADEVLLFDGTSWESNKVPPAALASADFGDFTCNGAGSCGIDTGAVVLADLAVADFGDWTCGGGACTLDADVVAPAEIADADFGDFTCSGGACTLDADAAEDAAVSNTLTHSGGSIALEALTVTDIGDDEVLVGTGAGAAAFLALQNCDDATEKLDWTGAVFDCIPDAGGAASVSDRIEEADSNVVVDDAGAGSVAVGVDALKVFEFFVDRVDTYVDMHFDDQVGDSPAAIFTPQTGDAFSLFADDTTDNLHLEVNSASVRWLRLDNVGADTFGLEVVGLGIFAGLQTDGSVQLNGAIENRCLSNVDDAIFVDHNCDDMVNGLDADLITVAGRSLTQTAATLDADAELYTDSKCINVDPASSVTDVLFFRFELAVTVTGVDCLVDAATSLVLTPRECDADGANCSDIEAALTCATTLTSEAGGSVDNASIDAGDVVRVTIGAVSGTPTQALLCLTYTVND